MILTQLDGEVGPEHWNTLKQSFRQASQQLPAAIDRSLLIQNADKPNMWRIVTIWKSAEALKAYRASVTTPGGVLMFRAAGVEPTLLIFEVTDHANSD